MPALSTRLRLALPVSAFGLPKQCADPMPDARAAKSRHKGHLTAAEEQRIDAMADDILART